MFNITVSFTHTKVLTWGRCAAIGDATLVDEAFVRRNPTVLGLRRDSESGREEICLSICRWER